MGLDMYLTGEKFFWTDWEHPENNIMEDGFRLKAKRYELGYWRKHPDLHGYIVETFADGKDECQEIELSKEDISQILNASENGKLPHTEGFFFGATQPEDKTETRKILTNALKWLKTKENGIAKSIYYQASW